MHAADGDNAEQPRDPLTRGGPAPGEQSPGPGAQAPAAGEPPEGFEPFHSSPFLKAIGPVWVCSHTQPPVFGMRVERRHTNTHGTAHGGMLVSLADLALGQGIRTVHPGVRAVTASLAVDFPHPVALGAWVEAHVELRHAGRRAIFASCLLIAGGRRAVSVSGVYLPSGSEIRELEPQPNREGP